MDLKNERTQAGFTLIELMITVMISAIMLTGIFGMVKIFQDSVYVNKNVNEVEQSVYFGMNLLTRELREAKSLDESASTSDTLRFTSINDTVITYRLTPVDGGIGKLERQEQAAVGGVSAFVEVANNIVVENGVSRFSYDADMKSITIRLRSSLGGRGIEIENTVTPRNF